jgi:hypothetical protein
MKAFSALAQSGLAKAQGKTKELIAIVFSVATPSMIASASTPGRRSTAA